MSERVLPLRPVVGTDRMEATIRSYTNRVIPAMEAAAEIDALLPSPRVGWRTVEELADAIWPDGWRKGSSKGINVRIIYLERALRRLVWHGEAERTVYGEWVWWRLTPS